MTDQPKKRGRPSRAEIAAREAAMRPADQSDEVHAIAAERAAANMAKEIDREVFGLAERAQAYAMRVWAGQSDSIGRTERIARVKRALEGQNLPTEGIRFPGSGDDDDWDDDDMQPVTWRKRA